MTDPAFVLIPEHQPDRVPLRKPPRTLFPRKDPAGASVTRGKTPSHITQRGLVDVASTSSLSPSTMTTPSRQMPDGPAFVSEEDSLVVLDQVLRRVRLEDAFGSGAK